MSTIEVRMISAKGCKRCEEVKTRLAETANKVGVVLDLNVIDSSTEEAVRLGIKYLLDDVPSFVIAEKSFCGVGFRDRDIEKIMSNLK
jgi:hypothetical protein